MKQLSPVALLIWGVWILWAFGLQTFVALLNTQVDGVVVSSRDTPPNPWGHGYATEYTMRGPDGHEFTYLAGPTDASLPRSMPVGTSVKKERWHLYYERNGRRENDSFPVVLRVNHKPRIGERMLESFSVEQPASDVSFDQVKFRQPIKG